MEPPARSRYANNHVGNLLGHAQNGWNDLVQQKSCWFTDAGDVEYG